MNAIAAALVMLWLTGWTLASVRAGLKNKVLERPARCRANAWPGAGFTDK